MNLLRYYNTIRFLKPEQLYFQLLYKAKGVLRKLLGSKSCYTRYKQGKWLSFAAPLIEKPLSYKGNNEFEFLNVTNTFRGVWDDNSKGALWRYNLNYMDFLLQPSMGVKEGLEWIERFIASMPQNSVADDPYPISLRGINWIKFVSLHYDSFSPEQLRVIDTALYSQYCILEKKVERHLLANHYLENGFSLWFAAYYFNDSHFFKAAEKIISSQLDEQVLSDGAHYELSPMYHCVILERLLDCYNIIDKEMHRSLSLFMLDKIKLMLGWLESVVMSDGNIPLLNDSALGVAPSPQEIFAYARALGLEWGATTLGESGYRKFGGDNYDVFVDVAALGPSYNLGHSHADTFTFVMNVGGKPFIIDTGTSTYTAGERRSYERSTLAHNTISVNGSDSSRVWGAFRCAERASVKLLDEDNYSVTASHNGYKSHALSVTRSFMSRGAEFGIVDEVSGADKNTHLVASFHLAPEVVVESVGVDKVVTSSGVLCFTGATSITIEPVEVAFSYNMLSPSTRISVSFSKRLSSVVLPKENVDSL